MGMSSECLHPGALAARKEPFLEVIRLEDPLEFFLDFLRKAAFGNLPS